MTRVVLAILAALALAVPAGAAHATPTDSSTVADVAGDQNHGTLWGNYPALRTSTDLRRTTMSSASGKLTISWTFAAVPTSKRAYPQGQLNAALGSRRVVFTAWRHGDEVYTAVFSTVGTETTVYCAGKASVSLLAKAKRLVMKLPVSCLPKGTTMKGSYAVTAVNVLDKNGGLKGVVGSDSSLTLPDLTIRD